MLSLPLQNAKARAKLEAVHVDHKLGFEGCVLSCKMESFDCKIAFLGSSLTVQEWEIAALLCCVTSDIGATGRDALEPMLQLQLHSQN